MFGSRDATAIALSHPWVRGTDQVHDGVYSFMNRRPEVSLHLWHNHECFWMSFSAGLRIHEYREHYISRQFKPGVAGQYWDGERAMH
jgi:hypothetical protein